MSVRFPRSRLQRRSSGRHSQAAAGRFSISPA
jgi:hypothetical protein